MMRLLYTLFVFLCITLSGNAQENKLLRFSENGEFKIVQFTDTHYKWGKKASNAAIECISEIVDAEKPDLVVFTGDQVYSDSVALSLRTLVAPLSERNIPFVTIFGNHDSEFDCTHAQMYDVIRSMPENMLPERDGVDSPDFMLKVYPQDTTRVAAALYFMDTHSKSAVPGVHGYAWLLSDQIAWYRNQSDFLTILNGNVPVPSLAFVHIPIPEYALALNADKVAMIGTCKESPCVSVLNSGMFTALKEQGDIMGVFCGHDHDNDFAIMYHDVLLAYGRYSGGNTVYNHLGENGARVIVLTENERNFKTWIRLRGGEVIHEAVYPDSFKNPKKKK